MKSILLGFLLVGTNFVYSQAIDWAKTKNWRIYQLNKDSAFAYPPDALSNFKNAPMVDSEVISFLTQSKRWPRKQYATWMGMYIASYETTAGQLRKVVLSSYGAFFFDSKSKRYYELPKNLRKQWNDFLMENLKKVFEE